MDTQKRLEYLKDKWTPYPSIQEPVFTVRELKTTFGQLTAGGKSKTSGFWLAGRVHYLVKSALSDVIDQFSLMIEGEEFFFRAEKLNLDEFSRDFLLSVLKKDDLVMVKVAWLDVHTSGLFPKIENMIPTEVRLLAPSLREPTTNVCSIQRVKQWEYFVENVRKCFKFLQFTEVRTPTLVQSPGLESFLDPFKTEFVMGKDRRDYYLPTSPEFHLKKALALGFRNIYEIKDSFRNGEISPNHQPEFVMLEWYRAYSSLDSIIKDVRGLLHYLKLHWPQSVKGWGPLEITTMAAVWLKYLDVSLTPATTHEELKSWALELEVGSSPDDTWNDTFHRIWIERIEPHLGITGPVLIRDFPPSQRAWARLGAEGWADRFEVYWRGVELANAFHEISDPNEQRKLFEQAVADRKALGKQPLPIDQELIGALEAGFPPSAGIALGLDRLFMLFTGASELADGRLFPIQKD